MPREAETITVTDLRVGTREILENAHFRGQPYVVVRAGQPMVVIVDIDEYVHLTRALAIVNSMQSSAPAAAAA
jgi:prevent-host-death family protein